MNIKKMLLCAMFAACSLGAFASSLSIQILQHNPGQENVWATTETLEQGMIDFFFEKGFVVSNSPAYISVDDKTDKMEVRHSIEEAKMGRLEYFAEVNLFYNETISSAADNALLGHIKNAHWKIYNVDSKKVLFEGEIVPEKVTEKNNDEHGVILFAQDVAFDIKSKIGNNLW